MTYKHTIVLSDSRVYGGTIVGKSMGNGGACRSRQPNSSTLPHIEGKAVCLHAEL